MRKQGRIGLVVAMLALGAASAFGQFSSDAGDVYTTLGPDAPAKDDKGNVIQVGVGDKVRLQGSTTEYTVGAGGVLLPVGAPIVITRKAGGAPIVAVVPRPRSHFEAAIYPGTVFALAGNLYDRDSNAFVGGTTSVVGTVYSLESVSNLDYGRRFELGGFYFQPYDGDNGDLYQVAGRYFFNKDVGFQLAYLDTTNQHKTPAVSLHAVFDVTSQGSGVTKGRRIAARLGVGFLQDFSSKYVIDDNSYVHTDSTNFSAFFDLSVGITDRLRLSGTEWFVRDRNADVNRFGLGLSYRF